MVLVLVVVFVLPIGVISGVIVLAVSVLVVSSLGSMTGSSAEDVVTKGDATGRKGSVFARGRRGV